MNLLYYSLSLYLSLCSTTYAASTKESTTPPEEPCTVTSPYTHNFFDIRALTIPDPLASKSKHPRDYSWNTTGWDLPYNFTLNFCAPVIEKVEDVVGVDKNLWKNVSAYYKSDGKIYSIGIQNTAPVMRGRKLVLNYTDGSPCDPVSGKSAHLVQDLKDRKLSTTADDSDDDDDSGDTDSDGKDRKPPSDGVRRKNTVISMLCDRDPTAPELTLNFLASPDECSYFFEARSKAACVTTNQSTQALDPAGVFGVMVFITIIVYVVGGCVYSRVVLQQRGWRQLPNYALWASIFGFVRDIFVIVFSSCTSFFGGSSSRKGYARVNGVGAGPGIRRGRSDSDAENRLIDELNEEWED